MTSDRRKQLHQTITGASNESVRRSASPQMLDLNPRRGSRIALPYMMLRRVEYNPDASPPLTIEFSSHVVGVDGSNLESVYLAVITQSALSLIERSLRASEATPGDVTVESLSIEAKRPDGSNREAQT